MGNSNSFKHVLERLLEAEQLLRIGIERGSLSSIERDILLEKLRGSYEQILFDRQDAPSNDKSSASKKIDVESEREIELTIEDKAPVKASPEKVEQPKQETREEPRSVMEEKRESQQEKPIVEEDFATNDEKEEVVESAIKESIEIDIEKASEETEKNLEPPIQESMEKEVDTTAPIKPSNTILAEKFQGKRKSRNEALANGKKDVASKLQNKAIGDLTKAIGINDKFLFTKELFKGNAESYSRTIKQLNEFDDINDALIYIQENFQWDDRNEAANQLIDLVRRKLLHE